MSTSLTCPSLAMAAPFSAETRCGRPSRTTSTPSAAWSGSRSSKTSALAPSREGWAAPSGWPTRSIEATRTSSTSGWMRSRRIISAAPYPVPPITAARKRLPFAMGRPYTGSAAARHAAPLAGGDMADLDAALAWLEGQRPAMESLLGRLVRQNSFTRNVEGVNAVVSALEAELLRLGLACQRIPGGRFGDHLSFETRAGGAPVFLVGHT